MPIIPHDPNATPFNSPEAPTEAGLDEIQQLTLVGNNPGGTFRLGFQEIYTEPISVESPTLELDVIAALQALPNIGSEGIVLAGGMMTSGLSLQFQGFLERSPVPTLTVDAHGLTGEGTSIEVDVLTAGAKASGRGLPKGALLMNPSSYRLYINKGNETFPRWVTICTIDGFRMSDNADIRFSGAGSKIGTSPAERFAFWGATPTNQPSGVNPISGVPSGTDAEVIDEIKGQLNDLISKLQEVGLIA